MLYILIVMAVAIVGGLVSALTGWVATTEPFDARKFVTSLLKSVVGAVVIGYAGWQSGLFTGAVNPGVVLMAFLSGAGVDAGVKRVTDAIGGGGGIK